MKSTKYLSHLSMYIVLNIVVTKFIGVTTPIARISFSFVVLGVSGLLHGSLFTAIVAVSADLIRSILWPSGPYFWGFTFTAGCVGLLYGLFHKKEGNDLRKWIIIVVLIKSLVLHLGMNTYWLSILQQQPFWALIKVRVFKEVVMIPLQIAVNLYLLPKIGNQMKGMTQ
ncbi:folate family ECF transporter S component [Erysipelothrix urinaevulpis]|uniref:folate family ECF transporter S component n=1 Tax=Erysipelothrix urinaevulpis TaxID=2683717 RepID=UPI00135B7A6F|nr:folate family ECF transporter S component [Erysipelothrix urinaevulpis]